MLSAIRPKTDHSITTKLFPNITNLILAQLCKRVLLRILTHGSSYNM